MTEKQFDEFAPFWGSDAKKYVLVSDEPSSTDLRHCGIINREGRFAVIIEDDELALEGDAAHGWRRCSNPGQVAR